MLEQLKRCTTQPAQHVPTPRPVGNPLQVINACGFYLLFTCKGFSREVAVLPPASLELLVKQGAISLLISCMKQRFLIVPEQS